MNIRLVDEVYDDLRASRIRCDRKRDGLGEEFIELFFEVVNSLPHSTVYFSVDESGYRPKRMPRFTAVIYYDLNDSEIVIVGVLVNGRSASNLKGCG